MAGTGNPETWNVGRQDTVIDALARAVAAHPERVMLDFSGDLYTYAQVDALSTRMAHAFAALGVGAGQTVLSMLDNNIDAVVCWLAVRSERISRLFRAPREGGFSFAPTQVRLAVRS